MESFKKQISGHKFKPTAYIKSCRLPLLISGDSGPYHIGVALRKPTLSIFNYRDMIKVAGHSHPWVRCVYTPSMDFWKDAVEALEELSHLI